MEQFEEIWKEVEMLRDVLKIKIDYKASHEEIQDCQDKVLSSVQCIVNHCITKNMENRDMTLDILKRYYMLQDALRDVLKSKDTEINFHWSYFRHTFDVLAVNMMCCFDEISKRGVLPTKHHAYEKIMKKIAVECVDTMGEVAMQLKASLSELESYQNMNLKLVEEQTEELAKMSIAAAKNLKETGVQCAILMADAPPTDEAHSIEANMTLKDPICSKAVKKPILDAIGKTFGDKRNQLLCLCCERLKDYQIVTKDFSGSFADGNAFCGLLHSWRPDLYNFQSVTLMSPSEKLQLAENVARECGLSKEEFNMKAMFRNGKPKYQSIMNAVEVLFEKLS